MKHPLVWLSVFLSIPAGVFAADTIFIQSIVMPGRVRNIDFDGKHLLIRLDNGLYLFNDGAPEKVDIPVEGRFSWFTKAVQKSESIIYHTDYIFQDKVIPPGKLDNILPGFYTNNITAVTVEKTLYVCYRGILLQYLVEHDISFNLRGHSIRHVYNNDSIQIISTYSGIYLTKTGKFSDRLLKGTSYSNGELSEIDGQFYLCQDGLYQLVGDTNLVQVGFGDNNSAFRKLIKWNGQTISLYNNHVSSFDLNSFADDRTLLEGHEFNDAEIFDNHLLCCTSSGLVFRISPNGKTDTLRLKGALHDLLVHKDEVIVSSDSGLFTISKALIPNPISSDLQSLQTAAYGKNIFITSLNGLYLYRDGIFHTLIPNIEFNKRALSIYNNYLYAGSVDGLYIIQLTHFDSKILPTLSPYLVAFEPKGMSLRWLIVMAISIAFLAGLAALYFFKRRQKQQAVIMRAPIFSLDLVINTIRENEKITSVKMLSEALEISVVQLNRKLKPYGETPLSVMQKVKKEIALEMQTNGYPLDEIAKRTGYSRRYVREQFFKQT